MGLLDGQIANELFRGFKGKLLKGTLQRNVYQDINDLNGDRIPHSKATYSFEGFDASYNQYEKLKYNIPESDCKIVIFTKSITTTPVKDDYIYIRSRWVQLRAVRQDVAQALYVCQAFDIEDPNDDS